MNSKVINFHYNSMQRVLTLNLYLKFILLFILVFANQLSTIWSCPDTCLCHNFTVDCTGRNLTALPENVPSETKFLLLDNNNFNVIPKVSANIEVLSIASNNVSSLSAVQNLPNLRKLNVSYNKLQSIPTDTFNSNNLLEILDVSYNSLQYLGGLGFRLHYLKALYLNNNKLKNIDVVRNRSFANLEILKADHNEITNLIISRKSYGSILSFPKLTTLGLSNNQIQRVEWYFDKFRNLKRIDLSHNEMVEISLYSFLKNYKLEELYLGHNNLKLVTSRWFTFNTKLCILDLSYNQIEDIDLNTFKDAMKIKKIDLSHNNLQNLTTVFSGLQNLTSLNLHNNRINYVEKSSFFGMDQLTYLNFSNNSISIGEKEFDTVFVPLKSLKTLDLGNNKILLICQNAFAGLQGLKELHLNGNDVKYIERNAFVNLKNILKLSLETSNLDCDCSLIWFKDWLKSKRLEDRDVSCTCASPAWLKGKDMTTLLNSELTCVKHEGAHSVRPKIIEQPKSKYGYLKGNFTLSCTATSSVDDPILIEWLHKDEKLVDAAATTINNKQQVIGSNLYRRSSLFIQRNIQFESEGGYRCVVRNKYGSDWSNIANMTVIVPPTMSSNLKKEMIVESGNDISIPCSAEGVPTPVVHFTKMTGKFYAADEKRIVYRNNMFGIQNLKLEDNGSYACIANSKAGSANATIRLVVVEKPKFIRPMRNKEIEVGGSAVLDCIISGNPRPKILWYKDGEEIRKVAGIKVTDKMLIITSFQEKDQGTYQCRATNRLGSAWQSVTLSIRSSLPMESDDQSKTLIAVIVIAIFAAVLLTSLFWYIIVKFCRRYQRESVKKEDVPIMSYNDELSSVPDLPSNFLLRKNGRLVSIPSQSEEHVLLNNSATFGLLQDTLQYLREQQDGTEEPRLKRNQPGYFDSRVHEDQVDEDDTEHDSGVLVHYKSGSSLGNPCILGGNPCIPGGTIENQSVENKNKAFITIDISDKDARDRRKKDCGFSTSSTLSYPNLKHSANASSKPSDFPPDEIHHCRHGNNRKHSDRRSLQYNDGDAYFQTYLTSSSGIESGVSSSLETISANNQTVETVA